MKFTPPFLPLFYFIFWRYLWKYEKIVFWQRFGVFIFTWEVTWDVIWVKDTNLAVRRRNFPKKADNSRFLVSGVVSHQSSSKICRKVLTLSLTEYWSPNSRIFKKLDTTVTSQGPYNPNYPKERVEIPSFKSIFRNFLILSPFVTSHTQSSLGKATNSQIYEK